jgi:hypothetical protein
MITSLPAYIPVKNTPIKSSVLYFAVSWVILASEILEDLFHGYSLEMITS